MARTTIRTEDITDSEVTTAKILDGTIVNDDVNSSAAIVQSKLATLAIDTAELADDAVTVAKMNDSAYLANRNLIINGACSVAQRSTSIQKQYDSGNGCWAIDRMRQTVFGLDELVYTTSQQSDGPDRFANSIKMLVDTAETSMTTDEDFMCQQFIEAQNLQNLAFGTSSAESLTLSFWVKSNVTGVYAVNFYQSDASRNIGATYEISSSATWEYKTITIAGDTAGTINDDTGMGLTIWWFLSAGPDRRDTDNTSWAALTTGRNAYGHAVDVAGTASNYWQMTGVQLEVGSTATPFEYKTYAQEFSYCQRYYQKLYSGQEGPLGAYVDSTKIYSYFYPLMVEMRAAPTLDQGSSSPSFEYRYSGWQTDGAFSSLSAKTMAIRFRLSQPTAVDTWGIATMIEIKGTWSVDAEL